MTPILLAGLFSSGAVLAQDVNFDQKDKDGNGYLSQSEWRNVQNVNVQFEQADKDGDQRLSKTEVKSATSNSGSQSQQMGSQQISSGSSQQSGSQSQQMGSQQISSQQSSSQQGGSQQSKRGPEMSDSAFMRIDANSDQRISKQEAQQSNSNYVSRTFDGIDENGNGYIEKNEIKADK
ncbi:MAG TPA: hypothetical protein VF275_00670 [Gammaproteobacteria bacterium]